MPVRPRSPAVNDHPSLPIATDLFMDDHLIDAITIIGLALVRAGDTFGPGRWWGRTAAVRRFPVLR